MAVKEWFSSWIGASRQMGRRMDVWSRQGHPDDLAATQQQPCAAVDQSINVTIEALR
jgi:hypothetical protein